jgi:hypothetical protein
MLDMNSAELFARGTLSWASNHAKSILESWNETIGWSQDTSIPTHIILFNMGDDRIYPELPYFLDFKNGIIDDSEGGELIPKEAWRDVIKSLLRVNPNSLGFVIVAETIYEGKSSILITYEGTGHLKSVCIIPFHIYEGNIVYEEEKVFALNDNVKIDSDLTNIFEDTDILN